MKKNKWKFGAGYVYILSNHKYENQYKIGASAKPEVRAEQLSRQTGVIGEFIIEWKMEVPDMYLAEHLLHYTFKEVWAEGEFFNLDDLEKAKELSGAKLKRLFEEDKFTVLRERAKELIEKQKGVNIAELEKEAKNELEELEKL
jgi:hypothetical protein